MKRIMGVCAALTLSCACGLCACGTSSTESISSEETIAQSQQNVVQYEDHFVPEDTLSNSNRVNASLPFAPPVESSEAAQKDEKSKEAASFSSASSSKEDSSSSSASAEATSSDASADKSEQSANDVGDYYDNSAGGTKIMGKSAATIEDMVAMYNQSGNVYPADVLKNGGAPTIEDFCTIIAREAALEGVRADLVFVQSMHETGWLQFGNQVSVEQFNFAGIGAVDSGGEGAHFKSVDEGIRAQVQHLKAYASTDKLNNACVDPRFDLVSRGVAPEIRDLSQKWASGPTYGDTLQNKVDELDAMS